MKTISIIFPAFDEANKITYDILAADKFIVENNFDGEIIVVDDGSIDNTFNVANALNDKTISDLIVKRLDSNSGKGRAVLEGVILAKGDYIIYSDVGQTIPFANALIGLDMIARNECDIANGSRKMDTSVIRKPQDSDRKIISSLFIWFVKLFLGIPKKLTDTQCGFKVYKKETAKTLYSELSIFGFMFEIEIILNAQKKGYIIKEFPVEWTCDRDSRLSIFRSPWNIIKEAFSLLRKRF